MKDDMKSWFQQQDFDTTPLPNGHREAFLEKLEELCDEETKVIPLPIDKDGDKDNTFSLSKILKWSAAATLAVLLGIAGLKMTSTDTTVTEVSPEIAQTQTFFSSTIKNELEQLNTLRTAENAVIIEEALAAIEKLELQYEDIKQDYRINKDSKVVIAAMIENFQNRIQVLEIAREQIKQLEELKLEKENENII
ncbi:hypothetical protein JCM19294_719 [Nonlabens tegetincola]|uniref:Uncharacterized protein n=1 Tax=Nonlabens tegetincola TaxID=323273 RepID=A0A090QRI1_9FLAO|nr:hypothetical protein [Nonlabens tegetincola]ARN71023.1 hypothetical protein BST91_04855 [Nonlabens tegetincola]GAK98086.1 hypothetical protein JCM19294_719 [Nonlabens tegetincola]